MKATLRNRRPAYYNKIQDSVFAIGREIEVLQVLHGSSNLLRQLVGWETKSDGTLVLMWLAVFGNQIPTARMYCCSCNHQ